MYIYDAIKWITNQTSNGSNTNNNSNNSSNNSNNKNSTNKNASNNSSNNNSNNNSSPNTNNQTNNQSNNQYNNQTNKPSNFTSNGDYTVPYPIYFVYVDSLAAWWGDGMLQSMGVPGYAAPSYYNYFALSFWTYGAGPIDVAMAWANANVYMSWLGSNTSVIQNLLKNSYIS